jgi:hypothetical protein
MASADIANEKLEALRRREQSLKAAIAAEKIRIEQRREKEKARLARIIGECVLAELEANPELGLSIEGSLKHNSAPSDADFIRSKGFRI